MWHTLEPGVPAYLERHVMPPDEQWIPYIEAWEPMYILGHGNACRVHYENGGRAYFGLTSKSLLQRVAKYHAIDLNGLRQHFYAATRRSQTPPLPVASRGLVFFAFKARSYQDRRWRNDGAMGYVANERIQRWEAVPGVGRPRIRVTLQSGAEFEALMRAGHFQAAIDTAEYFQFYLIKRRIQPH
ncbi:hypothetical protein [Alicyclobacillus macrosporangiidus]|uniref:Uncharacterized protein n=1 Tax=Alicyclobacillus macrosporangiidus TaxID=392015 RepID=A0A1I7HZB2_9BACL|nr:hypothetical protein [Alicyclobacillus macrosporangiidus]SFU65971.1 hypothetical protein SAMN05421543_105187 [Alicyclobacillus macrosporangiidus]